MRERTIQVVALAAAAVAIPGCGSSGSGGGSGTSTGSGTSSTQAGAAAAGTPKARGARLSLRKASFGKVLVGPNGHTVYLFLKDRGGRSRCSGKCADVWAPLVTRGRPRAGAGLAASKLATTKRGDGTEQVTYGGHPLYFYEDDKRPGTTEGEGSKEFGAEWYAVGADGRKLEDGGS